MTNSSDDKGNQTSLALLLNSDSSIDETFTKVTDIFILVIASTICVTNLPVFLVLYQRRSTLFRKHYTYIVCALSAIDFLTGIRLFFFKNLSYAAALQPTTPIALTLFCEFLWGNWGLFFLAVLSLYLCVLLAAERWFATVYSWQYRNSAGKSRLALGFLVVLSVSVLNMAANYKPHLYFPENPSGQRCISVPETSTRSKVFIIIGFVLKTVIPSLLISAFYGHLAYKVKTSPSFGTTQAQRKAEETRRKKINKIAFITTLITLLCWFPNQITFMLANFGKVKFYGKIHLSTIEVQFINSAINPFFYGYALVENRNEHWNAIKRLFHCTAPTSRSVKVVPSGQVNGTVEQGKPSSSPDGGRS